MDIAKLRHTFSTRIRKLRKGKMNQGEFADSVGVSRGAMSYYEQESRTPDIGVLRAICEKYDVSADYLLGLIPDNNRTVSDICLETGLYPNAVQRLRLFQKLKKLDFTSEKVTETVAEEFDEEIQNVCALLPFTAAPTMINLLLSSDEGLTILNLLGTIISGAELQTGDDG
ncbi:MAG: helix-turn-helix transcriptional regulator, partial [Chitinispirillales bacterium]|nr:helix-turn-helix transcriptional regulator [Chitinispirillales bacterium]